MDCIKNMFLGPLHTTKKKTYTNSSWTWVSWVDHSYRLELMRQIYNTSDTSPELMSFVLELSSGEHTPEYPSSQHQLPFAQPQPQAIKKSASSQQSESVEHPALVGLNCDVTNCLSSPVSSSSSSSPDTASSASQPSVIYDGAVGPSSSNRLGKSSARLTLTNLMPSRLADTARHDAELSG